MPFTFHPYLTQTASVNSCLFSAYPISLIGKADSQEDAPFSIASFMNCYDSEVSSANSSSWLFRHFAFLSCRILFFVCLDALKLILHRPAQDCKVFKSLDKIL